MKKHTSDLKWISINRTSGSALPLLCFRMTNVLLNIMPWISHLNLRHLLYWRKKDHFHFFVRLLEAVNSCKPEHGRLTLTFNWSSLKRKWPSNQWTPQRLLNCAFHFTSNVQMTIERFHHFTYHTMVRVRRITLNVCFIYWTAGELTWTPDDQVEWWTKKIHTERVNGEKIKWFDRWMKLQVPFLQLSLSVIYAYMMEWTGALYSISLLHIRVILGVLFNRAFDSFTRIINC